jgi:integrative and conjugative element protein (TIGR02256 family)
MAKICFSPEALKVFEKEIETFFPLESGGVLLGNVDLDNDTIFVSKASGGGPKAVHEEVFFQADAQYVDMVIDMEYGNSNGKVVYLGEWHTHPQVLPVPSGIDLRSLAEIAYSADLHAILLIIGAIGFSSEKFARQSISLLKYNDDDNFYMLDIQLG